MKDERKKELDRLIREERLPKPKLAIWIGLMVIALGGLMAMTVLQTDPGTVYGQTSKTEAVRTDLEENRLISVTLESGEKIDAILPTNLNVLQGARVEVYRHTSPSGFTSYRVVKYAD